MTSCEMCEAEAFDLALESFRNAHGGRWPEPGSETASIKSDKQFGYEYYLEGYTEHSEH